MTASSARSSARTRTGQTRVDGPDLARCHNRPGAHLDTSNDRATPHLRPRTHHGGALLPGQPGPVEERHPRAQAGPRAHAAVGADEAPRAETGVLADHGPLEDAAALAEDRSGLNDGVGRQGAAVADGGVGVDCC